MSKSVSGRRVDPARRTDPLDRLVRVVFRLKRRHYDELVKIAGAAGHLSVSSWLVAAISKSLYPQK